MRAKRNTCHGSRVKVAVECGGCGKKNAEYVLEDSFLCLDCYRGEVYYWAKGAI